ncbi:PREDICTED: olfactory receptor 5V1-like [Nanorana parkeri]|uniref:olfactory receptor 5V1-like n=1 Tax=Nanorana parkeri TaxID=125878 RepID=UPI0008541A6C|nr:PREDICTED: olfactory receptor 5V1-like [Nanorana parkeri]
MSMHVVLENSNQTFPGHFILLGLSNILDLQVVFFLLLLMLYMVTLSGNILLVFMVRVNPRLQTPMYFFLTNLAIIDICFSSTVVPKILVNTISPDRSISFLGCATQLYFHLALGGTECLILAAMAFDRYNAICKPLQYIMIMDHKLCLCLAAGSWTLSFLIAVILTMVTFDLPYCKANQINHFFCEMPPMLHLSCADIWFSVVVECTSVVLVVAGSFLLILISYFFITLTILNITSTKQRQKAFSTCASHLAVVLLFYGTALFMHLRPPSSYFPEQDKIVSVFYTVVTPVMNPIIYSIRNKEIKAAIRKSMAVVVCQ